jgi:hypothetical protein
VSCTAIRAVAILLIALLSACSRTVNISLPPGVPVRLVTLHYNPTNGMTEPKEVLLQPDSADYRRLQEWIAKNQKGWSQSYATNPSSGVFVHSGDVHLQFTDGVAFVFPEKGQFQKDVRHEDYAFLEAAAGI